MPFTEPEIAYVAAETLKGLNYLHSRQVTFPSFLPSFISSPTLTFPPSLFQIAHRDLKNLNIMLSVNADVKIIDFGLAVDMSTGPRVQMVGSPLWMAPEMIR